jgi:hypothetical protein
VEHGMMFRGGRDEMVFCWRAVSPCKPQDRQIAALGTAGGENNLVGFSPEQSRDPVTRIVDGSPGDPRGGMDAGGIAKKISKEWQHGFPGFRTERRGCVVIEIDHGE